MRFLSPTFLLVKDAASRQRASLLQLPMTQWEEDPPVILDFSVTPVCDKQECFLHKQKLDLESHCWFGQAREESKGKDG
jgi:hypothetical protein